jgi:hypothetical protein
MPVDVDVIVGVARILHGRADTLAARTIESESIVPAAQVLHECWPAAIVRNEPIVFIPTHGSEPGFETTVIGFYGVLL